MSQNSLTLPTTGTVSGLQMTQNTNNALDTLNTAWSGASAPSSPEAGQFWHDTTNNILKMRSLDNTNWMSLLNLSETSYVASPSYPAQISGAVNRIINSGMQIDQVNEGAAYTLNSSAAYTLDQWVGTCNTSGASGVTAQRVTDAPQGFPNSLKVTVTTGGAVANGDYCLISQPIEANNIDDLLLGTALALPLSLSFWVKSSVTGTFAFALLNSSENRVLVNKFTIASANVWTLVQFPNIPGDITGTWANGTNIGLQLFICLASGSTYQTSTLGSWQNGPLFASSSQTNTLLTTSSSTFQLGGVQLTSGAFCLPYEKKPRQVEQMLCERYYEKTFPQGTAVAQSAGIAGAFSVFSTSTSGFGVQASFRTPKRVTPTVTTYNPSAANANWRDNTNSVDRAVGTPILSDKGFLAFSSAGAVAAGNYIHYTASARM